MNKKYEESQFNERLKMLNNDIVWNSEQNRLIKQKVFREVTKYESKSNFKMIFSAIANVALFLLVLGISYQLIFTSNLSLESGLSSNITNRDLYEYRIIEGKSKIVLTEEGINNLYFPISAFKSISDISEEPLIIPVKQALGITIQAFYPTIDGNQISAHTTFNEAKSSKKSEENLRKVVDEKFLRDVVIGKEKALLYEPENYEPQLFIFTDKYYYYLSGAKSEVLIDLARLIQFEKEKNW